ENGIVRVGMQELGRIRIQLNGSENGERSGSTYTGYSLSGNDLKPLPVGSTLDSETGEFSFMAGPGFLREHRLIFIETNSEGMTFKKEIILNIVPRIK
ncbi:MAG: hypothetical protein GY940_36145, partial [bacterium]|nr:hypothetical protein [bacterium]